MSIINTSEKVLKRLKRQIEAGQRGIKGEPPIETDRRDPSLESLPGAGRHRRAKTPEELAEAVKKEGNN